ncbi:hypothetical protein CM15mP35_01460 [bacterium]|nr:MAG: hypothetical protein CM15mP35_01460 [bacterium]
MVRNDEIFLYDDERFKLMPDDKVKNLKLDLEHWGAIPLLLELKAKRIMSTR